MRTSTRLAGATAAAALGALAFGAPAFADTVDSDGVNAVNDNNISVLPVQACGNDIAAVIGVVAPILSPEFVKCSDNAPIVDDIANETYLDD